MHVEHSRFEVPKLFGDDWEGGFLGFWMLVKKKIEGSQGEWIWNVRKWQANDTWIYWTYYFWIVLIVVTFFEMLLCKYGLKFLGTICLLWFFNLIYSNARLYHHFFGVYDDHKTSIVVIEIWWEKLYFFCIFI